MNERSGTSDSNEEAGAGLFRAARGPAGWSTHGSAEHSEERRICLVVDDFGLHAGVTLAVLELLGRNHLGGVGCMVGGPAWRSGATVLRRVRSSSADVGLHLDFTQFPSRVPPRSVGHLIAASMTGRLDRNIVRAEIRAQLDAFERDMGRSPAFVDGHQHVHQLPVIRSELVDEIDRRYRGAAPWLRSTRRPRADDATESRRDLKHWLIERLGNTALLDMAGGLRLAHNRHLLGVYDFDGDASTYRALIRKWLHLAEDGDVLMCHPSSMPDEGDAINPARLTEYEVLCDSGFDEALAHERVSVWPLSSILRTRP
jgi:predicted glycoside hydrolase/deacetylase ChbG (UPF0249 family)